LTENPQIPEKSRQLSFFMDLLGHDVLNNNQAVLSYLELLLSTQDLSPKARSYAEKAISHVRTSTVMVENAKRLMAAQTLDPNELKPLDLIWSIEAASRELKRFFPDRKIKVNLHSATKEAYVLGNSLAQDLVMNVMLNAVRTNAAEDVSIDVSVKKATHGGRPCWSMVLEDKMGVLPDMLKTGDLAPIFSQDSSKTVRMAGFLFAKMIADILGGKFEAASSEKGAEFTLTLVEAGGPK